jgi:hypothetical protein
MTDEQEDRHSRALDAELTTDPDEKAKAEARNGLEQFDAVIEMVESFSHPDRKFKMRPSYLLHLHRIALKGISTFAGNWPPAGIGNPGEPAPADRCAPGTWRHRRDVRLRERQLGE